ncbi:MAG TPA: maltotransferase domain-containing protein, partial [Rudaea sp.]
LSVRLLWRAADETDWHTVAMRPLGNDRWQAAFTAHRLGPYQFAVEAGIDAFGGFRRDLEKKFSAGAATAVDVADGAKMIAAAAKRAPAPLRKCLRELALPTDDVAAAITTLLSAPCAQAMSHVEAPRHLVRSKEFGVVIEPRNARFASWYELFPRSQGKPGVHGTFDDVRAQLPRVADLGFDVLYFPPIHPIGAKNRKGKNNALTAQPGEPGSPYAIGAAEGGHNALHPQLGSFASFRKLIDAAKAYGIEVALDFAIQCSPDHPWIREHPEWFNWRSDGSLHYAENPPKKYEDIVNVDFYAPEGQAGLWTALRDVVLFWIEHGVRIFRVDNPHTKPLPFWEWMIDEARAKDPGVVFLSEAFTRPRMMYRLAKVGFSQSYTYFTWRNTARELRAYLEELNTAPVRDFFRPHFFVNTPDINPYFLQTSGRAGFAIRAALAATLSGLWGMYSGFELCESAPLPGREEYLDSEKYELRHRDWNAPGNINDDIRTLNRIRHENPALHSHLGITFYNCSNDQVLYFGKATPARDNVLLVAVCLDPQHAHAADVELPLWEFGLDDNGALLVEDLVRGDESVWHGKRQTLHLDPRTTPYRIWRLRRTSEARA